MNRDLLAEATLAEKAVSTYPVYFLRSETLNCRLQHWRRKGNAKATEASMWEVVSTLPVPQLLGRSSFTYLSQVGASTKDEGIETHLFKAFTGSPDKNSKQYYLIKKSAIDITGDGYISHDHKSGCCVIM